MGDKRALFTRWSKRSLWIAASALSLGAVHAQTAGSLDPSFGNGGVATGPRVACHTGFSCVDVELQADGKVLVVGFDQDPLPGRWVLARFDAEGVLDPSFGGTGIVELAISTHRNEAFSLRVQSDGKIVVGGTYIEPANNWYFALARFNPDGSLDSFFGEGGTVVTRDLAQASLTKLALQRDGKIVAVGFVNTGIPNALEYAVVRYNSDGSLDSSFGSGGIVTTNVAELGDGGQDEIPHEVTLQADGRILVGGWSRQRVQFFNRVRFTVVRYLADGTLDSSWNGTGIVFIPFNREEHSTAYALKVQNDGKVVAAGTKHTFATADDFVLARFNSDGSLDTSFGIEGTVVTDVFGADVLHGLVAQPDGKLLAAGHSNNRFASARYHTNGTLDSSFGDAGITITDINGYSQAYATALQPDGKVVAAGTSLGRFALARYHSADAVSVAPVFASADFDGDGYSDRAVYRPGTGTWFVHRSDGGGQIVRSWGASGDVPVPGDYGGDFRSDFVVWRPSNGTWYVQTAEGTVFPGRPYGTGGDIPVPGNYGGDARADYAVWRPSTGAWFVQTAEGDQLPVVHWGVSGSVPVPGDYDGDGYTDMAVYHQGTWHVRRSGGGTMAVGYGLETDVARVGDYSGDGRADFVIFRPLNGTWYVLRSDTLTGLAPVSWGLGSDVPLPANMAGDGRADYVVWRPSNGTWYVHSSEGMMPPPLPYGAPGDIPIAR